jgi:hypothetical protein
MDFKSTIDLIIKDLNEASEIIDDLKKYPGVPALQVELAKSKCKSAGEVIALLKNLNDFVSVKQESITEKQPPIVSAIPAKKKPESKESEKKPPSVSIVADKFGHIDDHYKENPEISKKDVSKHLKSKPVTSLSEAIGINDRFLFIREIFDGNKDVYSQAISRLDKAENLQDAMAIIMSYTGEKPEDEAVTLLLDLVRLKLPDNE